MYKISVGDWSLFFTEHLIELMKKIDKKLWTQAEYADKHNISRPRLNQKIKNNDYHDLRIEIIQINGATLIRKV